MCNDKNNLCLQQKGYSVNKKIVISLHCCLWFPSQRNRNHLLFATERYHYRKLHPKLSHSNGYICKVHLHPRLREYWRRWGRKTSKVRGLWSLLWDFYLLVMWEATLIRFYQHDCLNMKSHSKLNKGKTHEALTNTKIYGYLTKVRKVNLGVPHGKIH